MKKVKVIFPILFASFSFYLLQSNFLLVTAQDDLMSRFAQEKKYPKKIILPLYLLH